MDKTYLYIYKMNTNEYTLSTFMTHMYKSVLISFLYYHGPNAQKTATFHLFKLLGVMMMWFCLLHLIYSNSSK